MNNIKSQRLNSVIKLLVVLIYVSSIFGVTPKVFAQDSTLSGNVLSIPSISVDGQVFSIDLTLVSNTDPVELILTAAEAATSEGTKSAG